MKVSILVPNSPVDPEDLVPFARIVEETVAHRLWQGQTFALDPLQAFAYVAGRGYRIPVGLSVGLTALQHPFTLAMQARSIAAVTANDAILGVGTGTPDFVSALHGAPYARPIGAAGDYLTIMRGLISGGRTNHAGETFVMDGALSSMPHPPVGLAMGVLRPKMARLAGQLADMAVTWMTPAKYLRDVIRPAVVAGAAQRGVPKLACVMHVALGHQHRDPVELAFKAAHHHLSAPHYADMLRQAGVLVHPAQPAIGARVLVRSRTFVFGSIDHVREAVQEYRDAGVDELILNMTGVASTEGIGNAAVDLRAIIEAV